MDSLSLSLETLAALKEFALERGVDVDSEDEDVISRVQKHCDIQDKNDCFKFSYGDNNNNTNNNLPGSTSVKHPISFSVDGLKREVGQTLQSTGLTLWRAAEHLSEYIYNHPETYKNKSICELGAGLGNVSILLSLCQLNTILVCTDGDDDTIDLLNRNMKLNNMNSQDILIDKLYWGVDIEIFLRNCQKHLKYIDSNSNSNNEEVSDVNSITQNNNTNTDINIKTDTVFQKILNTTTSTIESEESSEIVLFDMVIGADIIYEEEQIQPLFDTVSKIMKSKLK